MLHVDDQRPRARRETPTSSLSLRTALRACPSPHARCLEAPSCTIMSLNGLNNVEVTQAYQGALAEAGGWYDRPISFSVCRARLLARSRARPRPRCRRALPTDMLRLGFCSGTRPGMRLRCSSGGPAVQERRAQPSPSTTRRHRSTASCSIAAARSWSNMCPRELRACCKVRAPPPPIPHGCLPACLPAIQC